MAMPKKEKSVVKIKASEIDIYNAFMQSPVAIGILKGKDYRLEFANDFYLKILGKEKDIIGKPLLQSFPELKTQGISSFIDAVIESGKTKHIDEHEFYIVTNGKKEQRFFNCDYQPLREDDKKITGIIILFTEVTAQVIERNKNSVNHQKLTTALSIANVELAFQKEEKGKRAAELGIAKKELAYQDNEKEKRAAELGIANIELAFQDDEKEKRVAELGIANTELAFQEDEKEKRAVELGIANTELAFQEDEKEKRAAELIVANKELLFQNEEKEKRAAELIIANKELLFQNDEKEKRAAELIIANKELLFQNDEKEKRAAELIVANKELLFQNDEKEKRAAELIVANKELQFQNEEKEKRAAELFIANKELAFQNEEKEKRAAELRIANYARSLIEASLDPLFTISPLGKITDMNNASVNITGVSRKKLIGTNFFDYFTDPEKAREVYQQVFAKGFVADYPLTIRDHKLTDVLLNGSVYKDEQSNILGVVVVARDMTEQKRFEKSLEKSLKEISDYKYALDESSIVSITDQKGIINYANDNFCKISKYSFKELNGQDHRIINSGYHPKEFIKNLWTTIASGKIWKGELRNKAKDNSIYWVDTTIVPFLNEEGKPYQYIVIRTDITEQKIIEEELTAAKVVAELATTIAKEAQNNAESATEIAENAVKAKQQFLSNMSHEIRTPMNAIIGFTKVVLKTDLSTKQKEYISAIKMSGDSLIVLINDILDLAKVDAGKMTFEKIPFKLSMSITAMLHLFETKIQEKNLELIIDFDNKIPEVLIGDPIRLHQIILNLISNAVKFTSIGFITVSVYMIAEDEKTATIEFIVKDTGIGIIKDKIEKVFDNFQQATSGTSRLYGGTGLGLSIVKQLVEPQGGTIRVESKIGEGSAFHFTLPFIKTKEKVNSEIDIIELDTAIKNIKVLVVEDIALNQLLMKTLLDDFGFECDITANGKIAIEKLQAKNYDIILMDLQMPEMNGFEATEYIRNTMLSNIPIIALTADVTTVDVAKCKAVGMNDYIAKPVDERLLYSKIVSYIKKPNRMIEQTLIENIEVKEISCIDLTYLNNRTKSNPALMMEMISVYLEQTPPLINTIKQSLKDKQWELLYAAVHKIIPSFSIMGINKDFEDIAKKIQEYASSQQFTGGIDDMVLQLENVCKQACKELGNELNRINNKEA
jgi:PAS domain S-box-containing protein